MRNRTSLITALIVVGLVPLSSFTWLAHERTLSLEYQDVETRHLLLVRNLSFSLSRYEKDVRATVQAVGHSLRKYGSAGSSQELMDELHIRSAALLDPQSQRLLALASSGNHSADADYKSLFKK